MNCRSVMFVGLVVCSTTSLTQADVNNFACPLKFEGEQLTLIKKEGGLTIKDQITGETYKLRATEGDVDIPSTPIRRKMMADSIKLSGTPTVQKHEGGTTLVSCKYSYKGLRSSLGMGNKSFTLVFENK